MQFLGRTEFGLSVMAVERHTHTRYTPKWKNKQKCNHCRSTRSLPRVPARIARGLERDWLKLVRINLI